MATPTRPKRHGAQSPATEAAATNDATTTINVHIKLSGTPATVNADFATLAAVSFTAASAIMSWDRG